MTARGTLENMQRKGTVKNGVVAVDLPDGTPVTVIVDDWPAELGPGYELDEQGQLIITPELEACIRAGEAEADRGEGLTLDELRAYLQDPR